MARDGPLALSPGEESVRVGESGGRGYQCHLPFSGPEETKT